MTPFALLKVAGAMGKGSLLTSHVTPSVQGGVVKEPPYWKRSRPSMWPLTSLKLSPLTLVSEPGEAILDTWPRTFVNSAEDAEPSEIWKTIPITRIGWVPSGSGAVLELAPCPCQCCLIIQLTGPAVDKVHFHGIKLLKQPMLARGVEVKLKQRIVCILVPQRSISEDDLDRATEILKVCLLHVRVVGRRP